MSYLHRLIERATDTSLDLENNKIGKYRITPQHGNVYVYHIYKDDKRNRENHICTITIDPYIRVDIEKNSDTTGKDLVEIHHAIQCLYPNIKRRIIEED